MWRAIKKFLIDFFGNIRVYPGGIVLFGNSSYKVKGNYIKEIMRLLQPGDVLLNSHTGFVSSWFIKGKYKHAGLYVLDGDVIHVIGDGIQKESIYSFLRCDSFAIIRCKNRDLIKLAIANAYRQFDRHVKYDYDFDITSESAESEFYCSEFTDFCFGYPFKNSNKKYIYPSDYIEPNFLFEVIYAI